MRLQILGSRLSRIKNNLETISPLGHSGRHGKGSRNSARISILLRLGALLFVGFAPASGHSQVSAVVKPIAKKIVSEVLIQGASDAVVTTGITSYVDGKLSPSISDPQFESVPKVFEFIPIAAELIDVATIAQGVWELRMLYIAQEDEIRSREAVDRMIKKMQATAADRAAKDKIARAAWFRAHLQRLIDANRKYHLATTAEDRQAALAEIARIMEFARRLASEVGINNVDLTVLTPAQAQTIAVKFFDYDLVNGQSVHSN